MKTIYEFSGEFRFLSNFYPCTFTYKELTWPNAEAAFQAMKYPTSEWVRFLTLSPGQSKSLGRRAVLPPNWEVVKVDVMVEIVYAKFDQNLDLKEKLLATGNDIIEEGNTWNDRFWGRCPPRTGPGKNMLGKILMDLRDLWLFTSPDNRTIIHYQF